MAGVAIGAIAGLAAGAFDRAIVLVSEWTLETPEPAVHATSLTRALLMPVLGGVAGAGFIHAATRRRRPQGIADVLARVQLREHPLSLRDALVSALGAALVVGVGQSGGREGPIVQLSSTFAAKVSHWLGVSPRHARSLIAAGGAAGVAASFNTPVAGAFFALEILLGNFAVETFAPVIAATLAGTVVGQWLLGDRVALHLPVFTLGNPVELLLYALLGAWCGAIGAVFKAALFRGVLAADRNPLPVWVRGGFAGVVVGGMAAAGLYPVMGNGYAFMEALVTLPEAHPLGLLAVLLAAKTTVATATGRSGAGLFAPSLFVGAVAGTSFGVAGHAVLPNIVTAPGAYGMVGMAAVASAMLHAPITMCLMLFEMTRNYQVILPLLAAVASAAVVSRLLFVQSIYERELEHQGIELGRGREELVMHDLRVTDIMREGSGARIGAAASGAEVVALFLSHRIDRIYVLDAEGKLSGTIDIQEAKQHFASPHAGIASAAALGRPVPTVRPSQRLSEVLGLFFAESLDELPVIDDAGRLLGVLTERDVVGAYDREVLRLAVPLTRVVQEGPEGRRTDFLELPPGEVLEVVPAPSWMHGRTLRELGLPQRCACTVIAVRSVGERGGDPVRRPGLPGTRIEAGEELVLLGPVEQVRLLAEGRPPAPPATPP